MPHSVVLRGAVVAAGLVLAVLPATSPSASATTRSAEVYDRCSADEVTVVVDFNELRGMSSLACAKGPVTAAEAFETSGFELTYARAPGMQGFVCSVAGKPAEGPCTDGDSYWSLWWSAPAAPGKDPSWAYATLGAGQLEVDPGGYVGFAWHEGDVDAAPPDITIPVRYGDETADEQVTTEAPEQPDADDDGTPAWVLLGAAALVLVAAGVVPLLRRRRSG